MREVLFEFIGHGNSVKVTATDSLTFTEISIICHARAGRKEMEALALKRLEAFLATKAKQAREKGYEELPCMHCGKYTLRKSATRIKCETCGHEHRFV